MSMTLNSARAEMTDGLKDLMDQVRSTYTTAPESAHAILARVEALGHIINDLLIQHAGDGILKSEAQIEAFIGSLRGLLAAVNGMLLQTLPEEEQKQAAKSMLMGLLRKKTEELGIGADANIPPVLDKTRLN